MSRSSDVDDYIASHTGEVRDRLLAIRELLHEVIPQAAEKISYGVPTLTVNGKNVVHFGGFAKHVSVYPVPQGDASFAKDCETYRAGRGTMKYPITKPLPLDVIRRQATFLINERGL